MQSGVLNRDGYKVIELGDFTNYLEIRKASLASPNYLVCPLELNRIYQINRIKMIMYGFSNTSQGFAFANYEQFSINLNVSIYLGPSTSDLRTILLLNKPVVFTDGSLLRIFDEPFTFSLTDPSLTNLIVQFNENATGSNILTITNYPAGAVNTFAVGITTLEGVSWGFAPGVDSKVTENAVISDTSVPDMKDSLLD